MGSVPSLSSLLSDAEQDLFFSVYGQEKLDVVIVAAGIGSRMQADRPKQYLPLGDKTVLEHTVEKMLASPFVHKVILVLHPEDAYFATTSLVHAQNIIRVDGGAERVDSVIKGLQAVTTPWVLVHDCARPFVQHKDIAKLLVEVAAAAKTANAPCGGLLVAPVADTLKKCQELKTGAKKGVHAVEHTVDRSTMYRAQTPQLFPTKFLLQGLQHCLEVGEKVTDEASIVDFVAGEALAVEASALNFKLTTPEDLLIAHALIGHNAGTTEFS